MTQRAASTWGLELGSCLNIQEYSPNGINQYTTGAGSSVDNGPEHEIRTYNNVGYVYINDERLKSASAGATYSMVYDALGRCMKRSLGNVTTYYIYDGEKPILEYDSGGTLVGTNIYGKGIDEILERVAVGSAYYPQQNHEGSVMLLTNTSGNAIERYRYDAFGAPIVYDGSGNLRNPNNTIYDNRFLFTGREYAATYRATTTPAFNFYEYRARAYNPKLGRFMSEDPKLLDAGDYNLFRYCHNDPLDFTDPMGLEINYAQTGPPISGNQITQAMTINERISMWQLAKESTIAGEKAAFSLMMGQMKIFGNEGKPQLPGAKVEGALRQLRRALKDSDDEKKMSYTTMRDKEGNLHEVSAESTYKGNQNWVEKAPGKYPASWKAEYNGHVHPPGKFTWSRFDINMSYEGVVAKNHDNKYDNYRGGPRAFADILYKGWEFRANEKGEMLSW